MSTSTNSVGIIGMGWVGSSIAISLLHNGVVNKLLLNDVREGIAEGEAMDLRHGSSFYPTADIRAARISEMQDCNIIVVTAGRGGEPGESRLDLLKDNIEIAKGISKEIKGFNGILVVVSNPVDVLTYYYQKYTGLPASRVIGTGTFLDTSRLCEIVGDKLGVEGKSVDAMVLGEHGDSAVMCWSRATLGGMHLREWKGWNKDFETEIRDEVRGAAQEIIKRKGATNHAIGLVTTFLVKYLLRDDRRIVTVSSVLDGPLGLSGVALSLPCLLSENGVEQVIALPLEPDEMEALKASAEVIRKAIKKVS